MHQQPSPLLGSWSLSAVVLALCQGCGTTAHDARVVPAPVPQPSTVCAVDRLLPPGIPAPVLLSWAVVDTGMLWEGDGVRIPVEILSQAPTDVRVPRCPAR
jgi:hypothetical protein